MQPITGGGSAGARKVSQKRSTTDNQAQLENGAPARDKAITTPLQPSTALGIGAIASGAPARDKAITTPLQPSTALGIGTIASVPSTTALGTPGGLLTALLGRF